MFGPELNGVPRARVLKRVVCVHTTTALDLRGLGERDQISLLRATKVLMSWCVVVKRKTAPHFAALPRRRRCFSGTRVTGCV